MHLPHGFSPFVMQSYLRGLLEYKTKQARTEIFGASLPISKILLRGLAFVRHYATLCLTKGEEQALRQTDF